MWSGGKAADALPSFLLLWLLPNGLTTVTGSDISTQCPPQSTLGAAARDALFCALGWALRSVLPAYGFAVGRGWRGVSVE